MIMMVVALRPTYIMLRPLDFSLHAAP